MGFFDRFRRSKPKLVRRKIPNLRAFSAAQQTNQTFSWTSSPKTIDQLLEGQLTILRARSREQVHNNAFGKRFISLCGSNIVGPQGVTLNSRVMMPRGKEWVQDTAVRKVVESGFTEWGRVGSCDVSGAFSWSMLQRHIVENTAADGEVYLRIHRGRTLNKWGFALEVIDAEYLDVNLSGDLKNGRRIRMGVEQDSLGRPVAYHFLDRNGADYGFGAANKHVRIAASEIIPVFVPEFVNQSRGIPWMHAALLNMNQLEAFIEAALVAARVGATKLGVIKTENAEWSGDDVDTDEVPLLDGAEPGSWFRLDLGESIDGWDPQYPSDQFGDFVKAALRSVASALGVPYNILANDLEGVSFSSIRHAIIEDQEIWKAKQQWFIDAVVRPVFEAWLIQALSIKALRLGEMPLPLERYDSYKAASWMPRRWSWIDPLKDANAQIALVNEGMKSRSEVIRSTGADPEDVWAEVAAENELMAQHGVAVSSADFGGSQDEEDV